MAKNLKLNIKNTQIAEAVNLGGLKSKLAKKKASEASEKLSEEETNKLDPTKEVKSEAEEAPKEEAPRIRARSKSAFAESSLHTETSVKEQMESHEAENVSSTEEPESFFTPPEEIKRPRSSAELRKEIFGEEATTSSTESIPWKERPPISPSADLPTSIQEEKKPAFVPPEPPRRFTEKQTSPTTSNPDRLGPTGRHIKDYLKPKPTMHTPPPIRSTTSAPRPTSTTTPPPKEGDRDKARARPAKTREEIAAADAEENAKKGIKTPKAKDFRDLKPTKAKVEPTRTFDARDRHGLRAHDDEQGWRKRRPKQSRQIQEDITIRPTHLKVRVPISIKDLAVEMKLKSSQLISKLFLQGVIVTLNDTLEDETTIQLLGQEFGCEITLDTAEEKRLRITDQSIKEELQQTASDQLQIRPPVVAFMGHVDHGKTSLIDAIRKSNRAADEAGAITQHIGAFRCHTSVGDIAILDTPGHEAFSAMRARGADVTDIVVLVVAGDEGLRQQSIEAIQHAKAAHVTIVVAINKADKPNFNPDQVYRQLADQDLLPEVWGGQIITVHCSAVTGQGINELLEMLALQAEVLELRANPIMRARGTVLESEMHKGLGSVATVLVQNGTLKRGDALVFGQLWGRVKTMHNEYGKELQEAGPSTPVEITGLSGLPEAGQEFIVVKSEREAREIADARSEGARQNSLMMQQKKKLSMENLLQQSTEVGKKTLNLIVKADVQGSLEALKVALMKIHSNKADLNIIFASVGEISESDVQLAAASKAVILGFHTQIESHAETFIKQLGIQVRLHDIIYHALDDVKLLMSGLLEKIAQETEKGKALVKTTFKSSHAGIIAGCQVIEGVVQRNNYVRLRRGQDIVWKGTISSLKRVKEDVREVQKGLECGILLNNFTDIKEDDIIEAYEITYITQEL